jgi:hypothetical protein
MNFLRWVFSLFFCVTLASYSQVNILTYHNNNARTGANTNETLLVPSNVNTNTFGKLFKYAVDGFVYAQPLYVSQLNVQGQGVHNVLFIATQHNSVYAFDADGGGQLWKTNLGISAVTPNSDFGTRYNSGKYLDITNEVGITGTPVIDLTRATLYVDAFTHEGSSYFHRLHAINITNGTERMTPTTIAATFPGNGVGSSGGNVVFNAKQQLQRPALTLAGGVVYVGYAGYADTNPYHGWLIGFDASTLQWLPNYTFVTTPNATTAAFGTDAGEGGIWMAGCGVAVDANTNLFFEIGNGTFTATNGTGGTEYGDSILKMATTNGLSVADYFTPYNQATLAVNDTDLGSSGLVLLPDQSGNTPHLLVGDGKEGKMYLINRDQFTANDNHYNAGGSSDAVVQAIASQTGRVTGTPAYFNGRVYFGGWTKGVTAFSLNSGVLSTTPVSTGARSYGFPGSTPSITGNGNLNGIVWALQFAYPAILSAYNANNLAEIYHSGQISARDGLTNGVKFVVPTIANGKVYVGGQYAVYGFGLLGGNLAFSTSAYIVRAGSPATITVNRVGGTNGAVSVKYATADGTGVDGIDYFNTSGTLNWAAGDSTAKTFTVSTINNSAGTTVSVNLLLSNSSGAYIGSLANAVLTITNTPYDSWKTAHFGDNATNSAIADDFADPDHDGMPNLLEYAVASDPNVAGNDGNLSADLQSGLKLTFRRNTRASDVTFVLQYSGDLVSWSPLVTYTAATGWAVNTAGATVNESGVISSSPDQYVVVNVSDSASTDVNGTRYFRLAVHR